MQLDVVALADAVEAADALFEQVRIQRHVPEDQMMRELEVAAFRADLRTDQQACAFRIGEIRGVAVAVDDRQPFVEAREIDAAARAHGFFEREHLGLAAADQQELVARMLFEQLDQPGQARVGRVVVVVQRRRLLDVGQEFGQQALALVFAQRGAVEQLQPRHALRKAADHGAAVAEHHAAGAVAVDQRIEQRAGGGRLALQAIQQREARVVAGQTRGELAALGRVQRRTVAELGGDA